MNLIMGPFVKWAGMDLAYILSVLLKHYIVNFYWDLTVIPWLNFINEEKYRASLKHPVFNKVMPATVLTQISTLCQYKLA